MENIDWNARFKEIIQDLDLGTAEEKLSRNDELTLWDLHRVITGMNEAGTYIGRYLQQLAYDPVPYLNPEVTPYIRQLIALTDMISEILSACDCPECSEAEIDFEEEGDCGTCEGEFLCDRCIEDYLMEELEELEDPWENTDDE